MGGCGSKSSASPKTLLSTDGGEAVEAAKPTEATSQEAPPASVEEVKPDEEAPPASVEEVKPDEDTVCAEGKSLIVLEKTTSDVQVREDDGTVKWVGREDVDKAVGIFKVGDLVLVPNAGATGKVSRVTTSDVEVMAADGTTQWCAIEDVRVAVGADSQQAPAAEVVVEEPQEPTVVQTCKSCGGTGVDITGQHCVCGLPKEVDTVDPSQVQIDPTVDVAPEVQPVASSAPWGFFASCGCKPLE